MAYKLGEAMKKVHIYNERDVSVCGKTHDYVFHYEHGDELFMPMCKQCENLAVKPFRNQNFKIGAFVSYIGYNGVVVDIDEYTSSVLVAFEREAATKWEELTIKWFDAGLIKKKKG